MTECEHVQTLIDKNEELVNLITEMIISTKILEQIAQLLYLELSKGENSTEDTYWINCVLNNYNNHSLNKGNYSDSFEEDTITLQI